MMYSEFMELCGKGWTVSDEEYKLIEFVYTWSPIVPDVDGKEEIVRLFQMGGMKLIEQLVPACRLAYTKAEVEKRFQIAQERYDKYQTIARMLDELSENSESYWEKASEYLDEMCDCMTDLDKINEEFRQL